MRSIFWLSRLVLTAVVTSMVCIASTFWAASTYVDMIMDQYHLKSAAAGSMPGWSQFASRMSGQLAAWSGTGGKPAGQAEELKPPAGQKNPEDGARAVFGSQSGSADSLPGAAVDGGAASSSTPTPSQTQPGAASPKPPEDAVAVFGHQSGAAAGGDAKIPGTSGTASTGAAAGGTTLPQQQSGSTGTLPDGGTAGGEKIVVSGEEFTRKKEQLSAENKNKVFNLLATRVPQTEIQNISKMMEDGLTADELKDIEQLLHTYLKPEEYTQLLHIIKPE